MDKSQKQRILRLNTGEWLPSVEAVRELYILSLGARIWGLKADGYDIKERQFVAASGCAVHGRSRSGQRSLRSRTLNKHKPRYSNENCCCRRNIL